MKKIICLILFGILVILPKVVFAVDIKINEILVHPSADNKEWVEFYNPENIDLSTYYVDDDEDFASDSGSSAKKLMTSIINNNLQYSYFECSSFLNNDGDYVVLFSNDGQIVDKYNYDLDPGIDVSIGRFPDGAGDLIVLASSTKGSVNSFPPTLIPTDTPTPTLTPTLSQSPTKTPTPDPTKTPTPTKIPTLAPASNTITPSKTATSSNTLVLGENTLKLSSVSSAVSPTGKPSEKKTNNKNITALVLLIIGSVFLVACAILIFLSYEKRRTKTNEK